MTGAKASVVSALGELDTRVTSLWHQLLTGVHPANSWTPSTPRSARTTAAEYGVHAERPGGVGGLGLQQGALRGRRVLMGFLQDEGRATSPGRRWSGAKPTVDWWRRSARTPGGAGAPMPCEIGCGTCQSTRNPWDPRLSGRSSYRRTTPQRCRCPRPRRTTRPTARSSSAARSACCHFGRPQPLRAGARHRNTA
jgi:hypothetical protein